MANVINGNTFYVDTASSGATSGSFVSEKDVQVLGIIFTSDLAGNQITLSDIKQMNDSATAAAGSKKIKVTIGVAEETVFLRMEGAPMRFPNGIWVESIDANSAATIIFKNKS